MKTFIVALAMVLIVGCGGDTGRGSKKWSENLRKESDKGLERDIAIMHRENELIGRPAQDGHLITAEEAKGQAIAEWQSGTMVENSLKDAYKRQGYSDALTTLLSPWEAQGLNCLVPSRKTPASTSEDSTTVTGTVLNACGHDYSYVAITFKLYDASGAAVGEAIANIAGLRDGERWRFKAIGLTPSHHYKFDHIDAN